MAKVIRKCWVWRKNNRWWRYLPRRNDGANPLNMDDENTYELMHSFPEPMHCKPPKLWVVWLFREFSATKNTAIKDLITKLFGEDAKPGKKKINCKKLFIYLGIKPPIINNNSLDYDEHQISLRPLPLNLLMEFLITRKNRLKFK